MLGQQPQPALRRLSSDEAGERPSARHRARRDRPSRPPRTVRNNATCLTPPVRYPRQRRRLRDGTPTAHPDRRRHFRARRQRRGAIRRAARRRTRRARPRGARHGARREPQARHLEGDPRGPEITAHRLYSWRWYPARLAALRAAVAHQAEQRASHRRGEAGCRALPVAHHRRARALRSRPRSAASASSAPTTSCPRTCSSSRCCRRHGRTGPSGLAWKAARRTFGRAEAVTTPTRKAAQFLEKHTGLIGVHAISCGIDAHNYSPNWEQRTENRILFVGRVDR